jgi:autotransporter-associated beta strand protein
MRLAAPPTAQAAVVYSGIQNIAIPADFDGVFLNVVTQQHDTTEFSGWDLNPFFGGLGIANSPDFQPARLGTNNEDAIVPLSFGSSGSGGSLVKDGASTLVLSGANSYSGSTLVSAGTLVVNGALASVAVSVSGGLSGTGSLAGNTTIQNGGTHAPGALGGVGSQAFGANLSYANHSIFEWDLNTNSNSNTGGGFDTVSAVGNISVGTTGSIFKVVFGSNVDITNGTNSFWNTPNTTRIWSLASIFGQAVAAGSFQSVETNYPVTSYGAFSIDSSNLTWTPGPQCPNPAAPSPACCWLPACCAGNARNAVSGRYSASPEWLPLMVVVSP